MAGQAWPGCCRYEIATEGDSFQLAFHTPADAVGWCLDVQSLLLTAAWPAALEQHAKTALRCLPRGLTSSAPPTWLACKRGSARACSRMAGAQRRGACGSPPALPADCGRPSKACAAAVQLLADGSEPLPLVEHDASLLCERVWRVQADHCPRQTSKR